jgi:hypothetical protein
MIYTAFYYPSSIKNGELYIRDNRFYPGKYIETFPLWYQYVRKNYPDEPIWMFYDEKSPYPFAYSSYFSRVTAQALTKYSGKYFWTMQRNLCMGLIHAYENNNDFFWLDNDAFLNTDLTPIFKKCDVFAPNINYQQFTIDSVCTFISNKRLHALDSLCHLPTYLRNILDNAPENVRAHTFQEGGLCKLFGYGNVISSKNLNLSHLSNYTNFIKFLKKNPLDSVDYKQFLNDLENINMDKLKGVDLEFLDMYYEEVV